MFSLAASSSVDRLKLMTQHNAEVMDIEDRKLKLQPVRAKSVDWVAKCEEVSHKCELYKSTTR